MFRRVSCVFAGALVIGTLVAGPAGATTVTLATGTITCALSGSFTMNQPLPNASFANGAPKIIHVKVSASMDSCVRVGVTGGKADITGGKLLITGILQPGASCGDISEGFAPDFTGDPNKLNVKWTSGAPGEKHPTVGHSKTDVFGTGDVIFGGWEYVSDSFGDTDTFAGETATMDFLIQNPSQINKCVNGQTDAAGNPVNLGALTLAAGSQITVAP